MFRKRLLCIGTAKNNCGDMCLCPMIINETLLICPIINVLRLGVDTSWLSNSLRKLNFLDIPRIVFQTIKSCKPSVSQRKSQLLCNYRLISTGSLCHGVISNKCCISTSNHKVCCIIRCSVMLYYNVSRQSTLYKSIVYIYDLIQSHY